MKQTTNLKLNKPETSDFYDIDVLNENMDIIDTKLSSHIANASNPHGVTKAQIGLGNVNNTADTNKPVSTAQQTAINAVQTNLNTHTANVSNPHSVTKTQVGLGNVPNVATNDQTPTYTAASTNTALSSGEKLSVAFGKIAKAISSLISHLADTTVHITSAERTKWNAKVDSSTLANYVPKSSGSTVTAKAGEVFCVRSYYDASQYSDNTFEGYEAKLVNGTMKVNPGTVTIINTLKTTGVEAASVTTADNGFTSKITGTDVDLCGTTLKVKPGTTTFNGGVKNSNDSSSGLVLHTGNSTAVIVSATAPTNTSAIWWDTSTNKLKRNSNGSWITLSY